MGDKLYGDGTLSGKKMQPGESDGSIPHSIAAYTDSQDGGDALNNGPEGTNAQMKRKDTFYRDVFK